MVAKQLGLSFDEKHKTGPVAKTDRVLMSEFGERFPGVRAGIARTAQAESVTGEFMEWALTTIEGHKTVKAKRQRRESADRR